MDVEDIFDLGYSIYSRYSIIYSIIYLVCMVGLDVDMAELLGMAKLEETGVVDGGFIPIRCSQEYTR